MALHAVQSSETRLAGKTLAVEEVAKFDRCASGIALVFFFGQVFELAPTQAEPPFAVVQGIVLLVQSDLPEQVAVMMLGERVLSASN